MKTTPNQWLETALRYGGRVATAVLVLVATWILLDGIHALWTQARLEAELADRTLLAGGARRGCSPFVVGEGETALVLVHGFADSPALFRNMADDLAARGFTCRAIRLKGFAGPHHEQKNVTLEQWRRQVEDAVQDVRGDHENVWIVAHSLGGAISLAAAGRALNGVDGLVLIAPLFEVSSRRCPVGTPRGWFRFLDAVAVFTDHLVSVFPVDAQDSDVQAAHPRDTVISLQIYRQLFRALDAGVSVVRNQKLPPVLMLLAEEDRVVDTGQALDLFEEMRAPRKKSVVFENSGHLIPLDRDRHRAVQSIVRFIRGE